MASASDQHKKFLDRQREILKKISDGLTNRFREDPQADKYIAALDEICLVLAYEIIRLENRIEILTEFKIDKLKPKKEK